MNYALICKAVLLLFTVAGAVALLRRRSDWLLIQAVVGIAMGGFNWYAGTLILPIKVTMLFGLMYILLMDHSWVPICITSSGGLLLLIAGALSLSVGLAYILEAPDFLTQSSGLQSVKLRPLVQAYTYLSGFALFPLALTALKRKKGLHSFCEWYIGVAIASALIALIQLALIGMGRPFMPILRWNAEHSEMAAFPLGGLLMQRLYGFAGEPKFLAVFLLPAIFVVLTSLVMAQKDNRPWWSRYSIVVLLGSVFVLTFSSAGLIAAPVGLVGLVLSFKRSFLFRGRSLVPVIGVGLLLLFAGLFLSRFTLSSAPDAHRAGFGAAMHARVIGRLSEEGEERYEIVALQYLLSKGPVYLVAGLGPGMYVFHLGQTWQKGISPIDSGWMAYVMDCGVLGFLLFIFWLYQLFRPSCERKSCISEHEHSFLWLESIFLAAAIGSVVANLGAFVAGCPFALVMLFAGCLVAVRHVAMGGDRSGVCKPPKPSVKRYVRRFRNFSLVEGALPGDTPPLRQRVEL